MARILLIDDDPAVLDTLARMLQMIGHEPVQTTDGKAAIALVQSQAPDLVITDIQMPGMDGFKVIAEIRKVQPTLAIIAMSAGERHGEVDILSETSRLGARGFIRKPVRLGILAEAIEKALAN